MNELRTILAECSINDVYCKNQGSAIVYKIPIYQRNYAWGRDEIYALIKDIYDSIKKEKPVYYIGTLVTYKRDDNVYEVIDGQQRLTTIYIILKAIELKTKQSQKIVNHLTYAARTQSAKTLKEMPEFPEDYDRGIKEGFDFALQGLNEIVGAEEHDIEHFRTYFLDCVHIIHYRVPKDVDLNHYFEVMNSRGEQLEKHEIVKAKLSNVFVHDDVAMKIFSRIWEASSDMGVYIQQKLPDPSVFGRNLNCFVLSDFDALINERTDETGSLNVISNDADSEKDQSDNVRSAALANDQKNKMSILKFLESPQQPISLNIDIDENDNYQPIIDFPNFLLIVLKITLAQNQCEEFDPSDITLDDKELINEFEKVKLTQSFVKQFTYNLLKAKYFLDNFVVHHINAADSDKENPWKLQTYIKDSDKGYLKDLVSGEDKKAVQVELVQLLSMFEVTFTAKQRKNYLFYCLMFLFEDNDPNAYLQFLRNLADKFFFDVYLDKTKLNNVNQPRPNSFDETVIQNGRLNLSIANVKSNNDFVNLFCSVYPQGSSNIPLFIFDYSDYKLWKKYADELRGKYAKEGDLRRKEFFQSLGCSDFGLDFFNNFYFSRTRKSLEHYYPQAKAGENQLIKSEEINCFGNFAMIGADANSTGSNWNPIEKKTRYLDSKSNQVSVASLKFRIMLQICQDNYDEGIKDSSKKRDNGFEWNTDDMSRHQKRMLDILIS